MSGAAIKLIVAADEIALFFSSIQSAESHLEWIDVRDGVYPIAYDPAGNVYRLGYEGGRVLVVREEGSCDPAGLNALLQKFIAAAYMPVKSADNAFFCRSARRTSNQFRIERAPFFPPPQAGEVSARSDDGGGVSLFGNTVPPLPPLRGPPPP